MFMTTIETERNIWKGIALGKLFVVDRYKDRGIGKTFALKTIAELIGVSVLVSNRKMAETLNSAHSTKVFIGQDTIGTREEGYDPDEYHEVLIDDGVNYKKLAKQKNIDVIGGVYSVDSARFVTIKEILALEK